MIIYLKRISEECFLFNLNVNASLKFLWALEGFTEATQELKHSAGTRRDLSHSGTQSALGHLGIQSALEGHLRHLDTQALRALRNLGTWAIRALRNLGN